MHQSCHVIPATQQHSHVMSCYIIYVPKTTSHVTSWPYVRAHKWWVWLIKQGVASVSCMYLREEGESSSHVDRDLPLDETIAVWGDDGWVDEPEKDGAVHSVHC